MSMTLEEAIRHADEVAEEQERLCKYHRESPAGWKFMLELAEKEERCGAEHRQLAEWLRELQTYREGAHPAMREDGSPRTSGEPSPRPSAEPEIIHCCDCKWWDTDDSMSPYGYCRAIRHGSFTEHWEISIYRKYKGDFYCADAEPAEDETDEDEEDE